jgi:hypothetical protein
MGVCHEVVCDRCGEGEGNLHQSPSHALKAAAKSGFLHLEETGEDLCRECAAESDA